jgi:MFS family permease
MLALGLKIFFAIISIIIGAVASIYIAASIADIYENKKDKKETTKYALLTATAITIAIIIFLAIKHTIYAFFLAFFIAAIAIFIDRYIEEIANKNQSDS